MKTTKAIKKENKNKQKNILAKKEDVETCWKLIANAIFWSHDASKKLVQSTRIFRTEEENVIRRMGQG